MFLSHPVIMSPHITMQRKRICKSSLQQVEYDEIKAILEPYWHLFNFALEYEQRRRILYLTTTRHFIHGPSIITQHLDPTIEDGRYIVSAGALAYPTGTPRTIRRQCNKYNFCDTSIHIFLTYLLPALQMIGAKIEWHTVISNPRIVFHYSTSKPRPKVRHSVFLITSKTGQQFIADFTIEQFGFKPQMWFMKKESYVRKCTLDEPVSKPSVEELEQARHGVFNKITRVGWLVRYVCENGELWMWERLDSKSRMKWLEGVVVDAL
jgi:hypothetical protein